MNKEAGADFSRTCEGCGYVVYEPAAKGKVQARCSAPGPCRGYVVGNGRFFPYVPAWCPMMENEKTKGA